MPLGAFLRPTELVARWVPGTRPGMTLVVMEMVRSIRSSRCVVFFCMAGKRSCQFGLVRSIKFVFQSRRQRFSDFSR